MLYVCIPAYNEAPTIGVLLWRIRAVLQEFPREYEVLVYDDGSTDATAETLKPYTQVLPLTVLGGDRRRGYSAALDQLLRAAAGRARRPRRDAVIFMQGDFTDQPEHLPDLVKRFESGADVVVAEHPLAPLAPRPVRQLRRVAPWLLRRFVRVPGVADPFGSFRLFRLSVVRELIKRSGGAPVVTGEGWAANVDLVARSAEVARRVETIELDARYDIRRRESRIRPLAAAVELYRFGRAHKARPGSAVT